MTLLQLLQVGPPRESVKPPIPNGGLKGGGLVLIGMITHADHLGVISFWPELSLSVKLG